MPKTHDVGVVIGRFQVHKLTPGHVGLIKHALDSTRRVIVLIGNSPLKNSTSNPLDFRSREHMIRSAFWNYRERLSIFYIDDTGDNESWAANVDHMIGGHTEHETVVLFGGRDSFIPHYIEGGGKHQTEEFTEIVVPSGTDTRREIAQSDARDSEDWRAALIYASQDRFPTSYQCVDIAVLDRNSSLKGRLAGLERPAATRILLGRKKHDKLLRFFGGFVDPSDPSLEAAAAREAREEANGIEVANVKYIGSARVADWRYEREPDGIMTALCTAEFLWGNPKPTDDLEGGEVRWVPLDELKPTMIVPQHRHLYDLLIEKGL